MGYGVYLFFASLMVITVFFIFVSGSSLQVVLHPNRPFQFLLPETKQIPLEMMDNLFAPGVKAWNAHAIVTGQMLDHLHAAETGKVVSPSMEVKSEEERVEHVY